MRWRHAQIARRGRAPTHGGPEVLEVAAAPAPEPGPGQVLVEVAAAGVNFIDVYQREGIYPTPTPFVARRRVRRAGGRGRRRGRRTSRSATVVATASAQRQPRRARCWSTPPAVVPVPAGVDAEIAAAAMLQGMTAHYLVNSTYPVRAGDEVLVHAAAGGVGQLLVQLAKARGRARRRDGRHRRPRQTIARGLGADEVIRYDQVDDLAAAVRAASDGGVHVAYDGVGKATFDASLASLRRRGMLALFGGAQRPRCRRSTCSGSTAAARCSSPGRRWALHRDPRGTAVAAGRGPRRGRRRRRCGSRSAGAYPLEEAARRLPRPRRAARTTGKLLDRALAGAHASGQFGGQLPTAAHAGARRASRAAGARTPSRRSRRRRRRPPRRPERRRTRRARRRPAISGATARARRATSAVGRTADRRRGCRSRPSSRPRRRSRARRPRSTRSARRSRTARPGTPDPGRARSLAASHRAASSGIRSGVIAPAPAGRGQIGGEALDAVALDRVPVRHHHRHAAPASATAATAAQRIGHADARRGPPARPRPGWSGRPSPGRCTARRPR